MTLSPNTTNHRPFGYGLAALIVAVDQAVKLWLTGPMDLMLVRTIEVLPIFRFNFVPNYGISLGLFQANSDLARWVLVALTSLIGAAVAVWLWRERQRGEVVALAMVLGGAIGNIIDRGRLGYVIDYADLHFGEWKPFLIFNIADAAITIGVVILLLRAFLARPDSKLETTDA